MHVGKIMVRLFQNQFKIALDIINVNVNRYYIVFNALFNVADLKLKTSFTSASGHN